MTKCYYKKIEDGIEYEMWGHPPKSPELLKDNKNKIIVLKRWLYNILTHIVFFVLAIIVGHWIKNLTTEIYWYWFYGWMICVVYLFLNKVKVIK